LIAYVGYLWARFDRPWLFIEAQAVWYRELASPVHTLLSGADPHVYVIALGALALAAVMLHRAWRTQTWPMRDALYCGGALLIPLCSGSLQGYVRYVGILFPLFLFLAVQTEARPVWRGMYALVVVVLSAVFAFKVGQWAAVT
jgi:hypothetical protein